MDCASSWLFTNIITEMHGQLNVRVTQRSQQTNIHAPGGIRTHDLSRGVAADLRLRPRGHWDRQTLRLKIHNKSAVSTST